MDIKMIAKNVYLNFSDEEWSAVEEELEIFKEECKILDRIETQGVKPMALPFELNENTLRMDTVGDVLELKDLLSNAPDQEEDMIKIVKVVG